MSLLPFSHVSRHNFHNFNTQITIFKLHFIYLPIFIQLSQLYFTQCHVFSVYTFHCIKLERDTSFYKFVAELVFINIMLKYHNTECHTLLHVEVWSTLSKEALPIAVVYCTVP